MPKMCLHFATLLMVLCVNGEASEPPHSKLLRILSRYQRAQHIEFQFKQTKTLTQLNYSIETKGVASIWPPDRFVWEIKTPSYLSFSVDKNKITIINRDMSGKSHTQKLSVGNIAGDKKWELLGQLLKVAQLDAHYLNKHFHVTFSNGEQVIHLAPKSKDFFAKSISLTLNSTARLTHIKIIERSGDEMIIEILREKKR